MKATIYHNPRCSKSREALRLPEEAGCDIAVIDYLRHPPTLADLDRLYARGGIAPRDGLRIAEPAARVLTDADDVTILEAMVVNPALIERPLIETERGVVLARPPERVLTIV